MAAILDTESLLVAEHQVLVSVSELRELVGADGQLTEAVNFARSQTEALNLGAEVGTVTVGPSGSDSHALTEGARALALSATEAATCTEGGARLTGWGAIGQELVRATDKTLGLTWLVPVTTAAAANEVVVVVLATDNTATTDGNFNEHRTISDARGNTWRKVTEFTNGQGAVAGGVTCSLWYSKLTTSYVVGDGVTITLASARIAKAIVSQRFNIPPGQSVVVVSTPLALANDAADAGSLTLGSLPATEHLWVRGMGIESPTTTWTPSANFVGWLVAATAGGVADTNMGARGEHRILTATSQTTDPTTTVADHVSLLAVLDLGDDPNPAAADTLGVGEVGVLAPLVAAAQGGTLTDDPSSSTALAAAAETPLARERQLVVAVQEAGIDGALTEDATDLVQGEDTFRSGSESVTGVEVLSAASATVGTTEGVTCSRDDGTVSTPVTATEAVGSVSSEGGATAVLVGATDGLLTGETALVGTPGSPTTSDSLTCSDGLQGTVAVATPESASATETSQVMQARVGVDSATLAQAGQLGSPVATASDSGTARERQVLLSVQVPLTTLADGTLTETGAAPGQQTPTPTGVESPHVHERQVLVVAFEPTSVAPTAHLAETTLLEQGPVSTPVGTQPVLVTEQRALGVGIASRDSGTVAETDNQVVTSNDGPDGVLSDASTLTTASTGIDRIQVAERTTLNIGIPTGIAVQGTETVTAGEGHALTVLGTASEPAAVTESTPAPVIPVGPDSEVIVFGEGTPIISEGGSQSLTADDPLAGLAESISLTADDRAPDVAAAIEALLLDTASVTREPVALLDTLTMSTFGTGQEQVATAEATRVSADLLAGQVEAIVRLVPRLAGTTQLYPNGEAILTLRPRAEGTAVIG